MLSDKLYQDISLPEPNLADDRFMLSGSPSMLKSTCTILDERGFKESRHGKQSHQVTERAFVGQ